MATAAVVRSWAQEHGRAGARGKLHGDVIADWDTGHPDDPYVPAPRDPDAIDGADMEDLFPELADEPGGGAGMAESRPRPLPRGKGAGGLRRLLGGGQRGAKPKGGKAGKKPPRVSTESMLGAVWRGAAKLATPLPPLQRTLRVQAPVAGLLLEDAVRGTVVDTVLQPFAKMTESGKALSALLGPPAFVTAISVHLMRTAAAGQQPNPLFMAVAQEGLRSSLMTWMEIAGPKFEQAVAREREFEGKYGADVDNYIAWLFSAPPATQEETEAEAMMFARATGHGDDDPGA
jgi:hypothetical protein